MKWTPEGSLPPSAFWKQTKKTDIYEPGRRSLPSKAGTRKACCLLAFSLSRWFSTSFLIQTGAPAQDDTAHNGLRPLASISNQDNSSETWPWVNLIWVLFLNCMFQELSGMVGNTKIHWTVFIAFGFCFCLFVCSWGSVSHWNVGDLWLG